jgi:hypothetical protein
VDDNDYDNDEELSHRKTYRSSKETQSLQTPNGQTDWSISWVTPYASGKWQDNTSD